MLDEEALSGLQVENSNALLHRDIRSHVDCKDVADKTRAQQLRDKIIKAAQVELAELFFQFVRCAMHPSMQNHYVLP
jgi:hypothetical protein